MYQGPFDEESHTNDHFPMDDQDGKCGEVSIYKWAYVLIANKNLQRTETLTEVLFRERHAYKKYIMIYYTYRKILSKKFEKNLFVIIFFGGSSNIRRVFGLWDFE